MINPSLISGCSAPSPPMASADQPSSSSPPRLQDASVAFRVVGVGASAGGMDAFRELLRHLPEDTGMAFVLIQHLHRTRANVLCETLAKATRMIVTEVEASTRLAPNCVYVIPSTADVTMRINRLSLVPRTTDSGKPHTPVNLFLNSLAVARGHRAVGVLLSGNTTDGTEGLRSIKHAHGVTMVQEPSSAKFGDTPTHAIKAGVVEFCLPIPELARKLVSLSDDLPEDTSDRDARSIDRTENMRSMTLQSPPAGRTKGNEDLELRSRELEAANDELELQNDELMNANRLLRERNDELSRLSGDLMNLLVSVDVAIVILDAQLSVRRFSPKAQALFNLRATDLGRPFHEVVSTLDVADLQSRLSDVLESSVVHELELKDRFGRWLRMHIGPYRTLLQQVEGVVLSVVDIHELKHDLQKATRAKLDAERAKQLAEQDGRAHERFMSLVTQELRTPLASVLMHAQQLRSGAVDRARTEEALAAIERAAAIQTETVNDLLDLSPLEAGRLKLDFVAFELCDVLRETLTAFAPLIARKSLNLRTELDDSVGQIYSDPARVRQIAGYLVGNAIKSTPVGGEITVAVSIDDGAACLCVRDSGIGIDPELLPDIFSGAPYRAGLSSLGWRGGLGLAIARHLVDVLGGQASAHSAGLDRGATFKLTFPMGNSLAAPSEPHGALMLPIAVRPLDRPDHTQSYAELQGLRVLVLDDEQGTLEAVQTVCRLSGLLVRGASSVTDALREFDRFAPQVLVCDPVLSREDGMQFIRQIRARAPEQGGLVPAMALTAVTGHAERERAIAAGFQLYVTKPLDIDLLRDAMLRLVRRDKIRRES
ncbi:MAG TPA: chemotaxis protein CheB [Polyangiales bacterium]|nr:chemotaxis protein CheB [Polyangiales bacterium]